MRRIAPLAAMAVLAASLFAASPAQSTQREVEVIDRRRGIDKDYPALTTGTPSRTEPTHCVAATFCDTIPIDIKPPENIPLGDDFYVKFEVTWDVPDLNDIDVFLYDDGQIRQEAQDNGSDDPTEPKPSRYTGKGSNTNNHPATITLPEPRLGRYNLVVHNAGWSDVAYHLKATMFIAKFKRPFEALDDPGADPFTEDDGPPVDTSGDAPEERPETDQSTPEEAVAVELDEVNPVLDDELDGLRRKRVADTDETAVGALPSGNTRPPDPPSGLVLLFWLAVVPASLIGGLASWLMRRRRAGFTFG